jgi:O-antigen ligase
VLLCWTAAAVAIAKIVFYYRHHPFPSTRLLGDGLLKLAFRPSSQYGIIAITSTYFVLHQRAVKIKLLYLLPLLASFFYMLLAQSRSTLLPLAVAMIAWQLSVWLLHKEDRRNYRNQLLIVMVLIFAASAVFVMVYPEYFKLAFLRKISYQVRLDIWGHLLVRIENAPWFGHGLIADPRTEVIGVIWLHPHSVYVATLLYGGIVGLLLLIAVVISAVWQGFGRARQPINLVAASMVLYGALCIVLNGNMLIHHPKPFWFFFWFPLALVVASELPDHPLHGAFEKFKSGREKSAPVELS